jgi:hypothetical protein
VRLTGGSPVRSPNGWWTAIQVRNHGLPVVAFGYDVGDGWVALPRTSYDYFLAQHGIFTSEAGGVRIAGLSRPPPMGNVDALPGVGAGAVYPGAGLFQRPDPGGRGRGRRRARWHRRGPRGARSARRWPR